MTDYSKWDFIKVMPNGVYNQEAHGSDIEYFSGRCRWRTSRPSECSSSTGT